jgi:hypothetical protein
LFPKATACSHRRADLSSPESRPSSRVGRSCRCHCHRLRARSHLPLLPFVCHRTDVTLPLYRPAVVTGTHTHARAHLPGRGLASFPTVASPRRRRAPFRPPLRRSITSYAYRPCLDPAGFILHTSTHVRPHAALNQPHLNQTVACSIPNRSRSLGSCVV